MGSTEDEAAVGWDEWKEETRPGVDKSSEVANHRFSESG